MALFTLPQMISRLTRGFVKVTGRKPNDLEKIKIKQEALERIKQQDKVVDMEGNVIDTSKGIMGGKQIQDSPEFGARIRETYDKAKGPGKGEEMVEALKSPGAKKSYEILEEQLGVKLYGDETFEEVMEIQRTGKHPRGEPKAEGGRIGLKTGMSRRAFLKLMGGVGAGIGALKTGILKLAGKEGARQVTKQIIKTDPVPGKPAWFDALVTKVINEGEDVTKRFATGERQTVHMKKLDDDTTVTVTQDLDDGAIRVEYDSPDNVFEDPVQLQYRKELPDEGNPNPSAEFTTAESGPVGRQQTPDDFDIEIDEVGGNSIEDLTSDLSKLKQYATGKKPTLKEFVQNKNRKDKAKRITEDPEAQMDDIISRQGEMLDYDDYASGGIARMLGE